MRITFLGGGNMALALIGGMVEQGFAATGIQVIDPLAAAGERLQAEFGVRAKTACDADALDCAVLILAVKPQHMKAALAPLAGRLEAQLVISIAAGLRLGDIGRWLGGSGAAYRRIVRCMPNTPALIGAGVTGLHADASVDAAGRELAMRILAAVGSVLWVEQESQLDAVTAISGSGPAYVFHFIESLEAAALALGFESQQARKLALDTVLGAAQLAATSSDAPAVLREKVTSAGGTTAAALAALAAGGWQQALLSATAAAARRAAELGTELGKD